MNRPERIPLARPGLDRVAPYLPHDSSRAAHRGVLPLRGAADRAQDTPEIPPETVASFVRLLVGSDDAAIDHFVDGLLGSGVSAETLYMELMGPAARILGKQWEDDECNFLDVTLAVGRMQRIVRTSADAFRRDCASDRVVGRGFLCCLPGQDHSFGLIILGEFLLRAGWCVRFGQPFGPNDGLAELSERSYDVVGVSVSCDFTVSGLTKFVRDVRRAYRNPGVRVMVGGRVINEAPHLVSRVGADATASDARAAVAVAASCLP